MMIWVDKMSQAHHESSENSSKISSTISGKPDTAPTPVMAQYQAIKKNHTDHLLFYRMGDFYELFYDDAKTASGVLNIHLSARADGIPMCGVPYHASETYLNKLIMAGFKVAICEQTESPAQAKKDGRKLIDRRVVRVISAGTITEDNLLPSHCPNYLLAIIDIKDEIFGIYTDISILQCHLFQCHISQLGNELLTIAPSEILIAKSTLENEQITRNLRDFYEKLTTRPAHQFDAKNGKNWTINQIGSMMTLFFTEQAVTDFESAKTTDKALYAKYFHGMLNEGIYLAPSQYESWFVCTEINTDIVDRILSAHEKVVKTF